MSETKQRIIIVDDDVAIMRCVGRCLSEQVGLDVVGFAEHAQAGVALALELEPDVVLLDIHMPGADAFWACREIDRQSQRRIRTLFYTGFPKDKYLDACIAAGGAGMLSKHTESLENIALAVKHVLRGHTYFSKELADRLVESIAGAPKSRLATLSDREKEVLRQLAGGKSNREIADGLGIGLRSVEKAVYDLKHSLNLATTNELLVYAAREGIVFPELQSTSSTTPSI